MGQFLNSINEVRKNYKKYDAWEQAQSDERAKKEYLTQTLEIPEDKLELTTQKAKVVIRATEILDKRSEDNCENMEQLTGIITAIPLALGGLAVPLICDRYFQKKIKNLNLKIENLRTKLAATGITNEVKTSIKKELAVLTDKVSDLSLKKGIYSQMLALPALLAFTTGAILWGNSKQKEASRIGRFQAKNKELQDVKNFVIYTPEQIEQAKKIAENIPDKKEKNNIIKIFSELKEVWKDKKIYKEWAKNKDPQEIEKLKALNYTSEQLVLGNEDKELIVDVVKEINIKAEEYSENLENAYDTLGTCSWVLAAPAGFLISKVLKIFNASKSARAIFSFAVPIITSLSLSTAGTVEQKEASRVGRYEARKELLKNPARLMAFSEEDMKKAKDIKADKQKQSFFAKIGDSFAFMARYIKDKKAYDKYRKEEYAQTEKLQKALSEIEVSEQQKKDAKKLQTNVFRAFDEVDEMSQRYSEDIEAGCEIAKQIVGNIWSVGGSVVIIAGANALIKGNLPISKIVNSIVNIGFKKESSIRAGVNNLYNVIKQDKDLMHKFHLAITDGKLASFLGRKDAAPISAAIGKLMLENASLFAGLKSKSAGNSVLSVISGQLKDGAVAKWVRNMITQGSNLYAKHKYGSEIPIEVQKEAGMLGWKNYKTLIGTGAVAGLPVLGVVLGIPFVFNAWLTSIQKKAGKIGIMKAMDKIDDPRVFAQQDKKSEQTNLLKQIDI